MLSLLLRESLSFQTCGDGEGGPGWDRVPCNPFLIVIFVKVYYFSLCSVFRPAAMIGPTHIANQAAFAPKQMARRQPSFAYRVTERFYVEGSMFTLCFAPETSLYKFQSKF